MTHSVNGTIFSRKEFDLDYDRINVAVMEFMRERGDYFSRYDKSFGVTTYSREEQMHPFIDIHDGFAVEMADSLRHMKGSRLILSGQVFPFIRVRSGSHVGLNDAPECRLIYQTASALVAKMKKLLPRKSIDLVFDNENKVISESIFGATYEGRDLHLV